MGVAAGRFLGPHNVADADCAVAGIIGKPQKGAGQLADPFEIPVGGTAVGPSWIFSVRSDGEEEPFPVFDAELSQYVRVGGLPAAFIGGIFRAVNAFSVPVFIVIKLPEGWRWGTFIKGVGKAAGIQIGDGCSEILGDAVVVIGGGGGISVGAVFMEVAIEGVDAVINTVDLEGGGGGAEICHVASHFCTGLGFEKIWDCDGREYGDDGNDNEEFDQREGITCFHWNAPFIRLGCLKQSGLLKSTLNIILENIESGA